MATYTLGYFAVGNMTITNLADDPLLGGDLSTGQPGSTGAGAIGDTFVLNSIAMTSITVQDEDLNFQDGDITSATAANNQTIIIGPGAGSSIQAEYAVNVQALVNGVPTGPIITLYAVNVGGNNGVGLIGPPGALQTGVTYIVVGNTDGPTIPFSSLACFTHGTMIETADGTRVIEDIAEGDLVATLDHGSQVVRWIGSRHISVVDMMANPALRPVRFETGAIGNTRPLLVSPQHRMLLNDWRAQVYFGEEQVLIAAKALVNGTTIKQVTPMGGVTYCHLLCDQHEILIAEGALSESFHPSDASLDVLTQDQQREIEVLFPELNLGMVSRRTAYPVVRVQDAKSMRVSA